MASEQILDYENILLDSNRDEILWNDLSVLHKEIIKSLQINKKKSTINLLKKLYKKVW